MIVFALRVAAFIGGRVLSALGVRALASALVSGSIRAILTSLARVAFTALLAVSFVSMVQFIIGAIRFIVNFNWNISDTAIKAQIDNSYKMIAARAGGAFGVTCGWLISGVVGGALVAKINPLALAMITENVAEEAADEIYGEWASFCWSTAQTLMINAFLSAYKSARSFLKRSGAAALILGTEKANKWGKENGPPVTIAKGIEDAIENIKDETLRAFFEEFWEELWDSMAEGFILYAQNLDVYKSQQISTSWTTAGSPAVVEITPNRNEPLAPKIIIGGPSRTLESQIGFAISQHKMLKDKDVGIVLAPSIDDTIQYRQPSSTKYEAHIEFFNLPNGKPPIPRKNRIRAFYKIPDFNPAYLNDYAKIKRAASVTGDNGYYSGKFAVSTQLSNGGKMTVNCQSAAMGQELIENLLSLSSGVSVRRFLTYHNLPGGNIPATEITETGQRMYPYRIVFIRHKHTSNPEEGRVRIADGQRVKYLKASAYLWPDEKPSNWEYVISQLTTD